MYEFLTGVAWVVFASGIAIFLTYAGAAVLGSTKGN